MLTERHILRYKTQAKAAETFKSVPHPIGRSPTIRHGSFPSAGSQRDLQAMSESSGDRESRIPLRQVVAVFRLDDGKPYFAIEICYLDEESSQASAMTLQFTSPEERNLWLTSLRQTVSELRSQEAQLILAGNLASAARAIERENDYDPANCAIYKVVQRHSATKSISRASSDDLTKVASTVCFLAIGVHQVHIIQLGKAIARGGSPSLTSSTSHASYGVLNLTSIRVSEKDDTFELTFRRPHQRPKHLYLAASVAHDIVARLHFAENYLRPEAGRPMFKLSAPPELDSLLALPLASDEEHDCLDRTLTAYCVAYGLSPTSVRYTINYECEDAPRFVLLPAADPRRPYGPTDLLAIMRALRYNESFCSLSFAGISLDSLNGLHDNYGQEHVCLETKRGTPIKLSEAELTRSCLLVQELRALAVSSKRLRRMDFSGCIFSKATVFTGSTSDTPVPAKDLGCGIVEALFPLCKHQTTNVDWICLNDIQLSDTDLDYLVGAAVEKSCHIRAIELSRCGLTDRSMGLVLDALRAQENTLEAIEIAGNPTRLNPAAFDSQLSVFGFIRKLNLSQMSRTSGSEPLLQAETLLTWRLQELRLTATALNPASIDAIATYLAHPQSSSLRELHIDSNYLSGNDIATLLHSMTTNPTHARELHFDVSHNYLSKGLEHVTEAVASGNAPTHLSMRAIDYKKESLFRKMISALTVNTTIRHLDMSQTALPGDASDEACRDIEKFLAQNYTILDLDISGEESRLATSRLGPGINQALRGMCLNKTMQSLKVERQKLGLQGASTLAEVLKENNTLRELHCNHNEIPLQGLTDLVNSLVDNTALVHLPSMDDGREASFRSAELTMKVMSDSESPMAPRPYSHTWSKQPELGNPGVMKRGLASVRRTTRSASSYTPSFPAMPSYGRSTPSLDSSNKASSPLSLHLSSPRTRQSAQSPTPAPAFTAQDIQTTHRLLSEQWDRQCSRLSQYLERNWCMLSGRQVDLQPESSERPESVASLGRILEQIKIDTTPRAEKEAYFDSPLDATAGPGHEKHDSGNAESPTTEKRTMSFKQFLLESGPPSPDMDDLKPLRVNTDLG